MKISKNLKVALVCDWLTEVGGAEEVLLTFHKMFPKAPIYTSQYRKGRIDWFKTEIKTGYLNYFPVWTRRFIAPLRQKYFEKLDLSGYDLVISVTGCDAKLIKTDGVHLCFCHVPTQYYWGKREDYLKNPGFGALNPLVRAIYRKFLPKLQAKDFAGAKNPDKYLTVSNFAKQEIKSFYKREAKVVSPPVNWALFAQAVDNYNMKKGKSQMKNTTYKTIKSNRSQARISEQKFCTKLESVENLSVLAQVVAKYPDGFYLNFSRQVNWKRLDLIIEACKNLNLPLVLVGNGPENKRLKKLSRNSDNITFIDFLPKTDLAMLSSLAKAFIFPSKEPFGIAPVEALAAGCPVIALEAGGALDFIKPGKNGLFFDEQNADSLEKALIKFETKNVSLDSPEKISKSVKKFSIEDFEQKIRKTLKDLSSKAVTKDVKRQTAKTKISWLEKMNRIRRALILSLPLVLFFSNFPLINFSDTTSQHLELSLPLLWLLFFSILSLKDVVKYVKENLKTPLLAFPAFLVLSLLITSDKLRGLLTFGVLICLLISILGLRIYLKTEKLPKNFRKVILIETVIVCLFCLIQSLFDALGVSRDLTQICKTCSSDSFGFPHPNGFAIEPQFMGSLLIALLLLTFNSLLENKMKKSQEKTKNATLLVSILIFTVIFLTFSRGAIYATLASLIFLIVVKKSVKKTLIIVGTSVISFILALTLQGILAVLGPTNATFDSAIKTSLSQLTLGKINLTETISDNTEPGGEFPEPAIEIAQSPIFNGYVAESTDRRLELSNFALKIAVETPTNTVFGTGIGSAGTEMYNHFPERQGHKKEIVQNEYLEILLEFGIIGIIALLLSLVTFIKIENFHFEPYTASLLVSSAITLLFFSGLPNALHVYLIPVLWYNLMYDKNRLSRV